MDVLLDETRTILFSSHNTVDVEQIADQITFIDQGGIIESSDKETFLDQWRQLRIEVPPEDGTAGPTRCYRRQANWTCGHRNGQQIPAGYYQGVSANRGYDSGCEHMLTLEEIFIANIEHNRGV